MNSSAPPTLSPEEQEQLLQTIEMFEVIVQANPHDVQSLEILKDAYFRINKATEMLQASRKLAEAYMEAGQYSSALLEYESILQRDTDNPEIIAALGEVEERLHRSGQARPVPLSPPSAGINVDFRNVVADSGTIMATGQTLRPDGMKGAANAAARMEEMAQSLKLDGNEAFAKFLIQHRLAPEDIVKAVLERTGKHNKDLPASTMAMPLLGEVVQRAGLDMEQVLAGILDRCKFAYIPLEYYEVDRQVVKMLPESLTLGRLMVPFDVISRTVMIATPNPFDAVGKEAVQQILDYNIQWHLASPQSVIKVLSDTYKVQSSTSPSSGSVSPVSAEPIPPLATAPGGPGAAAPSSDESPAAPGPDTSHFRLASSS